MHHMVQCSEPSTVVQRMYLTAFYCRVEKYLAQGQANVAISQQVYTGRCCDVTAC